MNRDRLTIGEAAALLKVSKDTVRRRIKLKELEAELVVGPYGEQYFLPRAQFDQATMTKDVVPMTRQVSVADLQFSIRTAIEEAVATQTAPLREKVESLEAKLDAQTQLLDGHYKLVDDRLRQLTGRDDPKSDDRPGFWSRLFGR